MKHWVEVGGVPSETVRSIIKREYPGYIEGIETGRIDKIRQRRSARKARVASKN